MTTECCPLIEDSYPVESMPEGWETASVRFRRTNGEEETRVEIIHLATRKRFMHEPLRMIALKCVEIWFAIVPYTLAYLALNLLRVPLTTLRVTGLGLYGSVRSSNFSEAFQTLLETAKESGCCFILSLWTVVRSPFYATQMWFGASLGMIQPLEGRRWLSAESDWHGKSVHQSITHLEESPSICDILTKPDLEATFFLAACMQSFGSLDDPHILSKTTLHPAESRRDV